jgi:hypothetical protein
MAKFIRWETPFTDREFPSVGLLVSQANEDHDDLLAVVAPDGIDRYPKYVVNFGSVLAFTCMEELGCPERDFGELTIEDPKLCAYQCLDSPWLNAYAGLQRQPGPLNHYLIFGGDNNIEVVSYNVPTIETITEARMLQLDYGI